MTEDFEEGTKETFDALTRMSKIIPEIKGSFARGTGGVDFNYIIPILVERIENPDKPPKVYDKETRTWVYPE